MPVIDLDTDLLIQVCKRNDVSKVGIFGSFARGEATEESDLDILVAFQGKKSLLSVVRLERELSEALNRRVDVLTEAAISPYLKDRILADLQVVYESR